MSCFSFVAKRLEVSNIANVMEGTLRISSMRTRDAGGIIPHWVWSRTTALAPYSTPRYVSAFRSGARSSGPEPAAIIRDALRHAGDGVNQEDAR